MNNLDLVNDALALIGVLPEGQDASAENGALALRFANDLIEEWADDNLTLNWTPQSDLSASNDLKGVELNAVKYNLAITLCPVFGREPSKTLMFLAGQAFGRLVALQVTRNVEPVTLVVPLSEARAGLFDITSGTIV